MERGRYLRGIKRIYFVVAFLIFVSLIYAVIISIYQKNYLVLFVSLLTMGLVALPYFVRRLKIILPTEIELIIILFIYATLFLGEVQDFYTYFWWWDILTHGFSAIVFGFIGFTVLYFMVNRHELSARPWAIAVFSFSFAIAIGVIWEIFEFSMDQFFGLNMQGSGLIDTMGDLIVDAVGALFSSTIAFIYLKSRKTLIFNTIFKKRKK